MVVSGNSLPTSDGTIENVVGRLPSAVFACRHQMRVDAQREAGVGVAEELREGTDGSACLELDACIEVAEGVHALSRVGSTPAAMSAGFQICRLK